MTIGGNSYTGFTLTEADGYQKLTISKEALTGDVTIRLTASGKMYPVEFRSEEGTTNMPVKATGRLTAAPIRCPRRCPPAPARPSRAGRPETATPISPATPTPHPQRRRDLHRALGGQGRRDLTYANGGYTITLPQGYTGYVGDKVKAADGPSLTDYRFKHWQGSDGKTYAEKAEIELTGDLTLTAVYDKLYDLLLTGEGLTPTTKQAISGEEIALTVPTAPQGKVFTGWKSSADGKIYTDKYIMPRRT